MSKAEGQSDAVTITPGPSLSGERCREIREELRQLVSAGQTNLILDLRETTELSPSGIYLLLATRHSLRKNTAGRLALANLADELRQLLADLHLDEELGLNA